MRQFSASELKQYLEHAGQVPLLLDVREPWEFQICHIEGSRLVPMRQLPSVLEDLDSAHETVIICHHGIRSYQVAFYLERAGFRNVINLQGGVAAWAREVDPTMATY
jgi:rhodanese-related sulfurtransferase